LLRRPPPRRATLDGVLLLEKRRFVRIAWRVGLRFAVDLSSTEATDEFADVEFASGVATVEDFVSAIGKLASHLSAPKHLP
jgi:hypothetical protein